MLWLRESLLSALWLAAAADASANLTSFKQRCSSLADQLELAGASNLSSEFISANTTLNFNGTDPSCGRSSQKVSKDLCRVSATIATSNRSSFAYEAWMPLNWSQRFLSTGNGGLGGCIQYSDIDYATSLGFAAVGTNNGHDGMTGEAFLNNPDVIADFAYRAMHTGVVLGKDITETFYGKPHSKSYYLGCSTGGRQGWKAVQSFPEDFDGVVAGAPAFSFNNLTSWSTHFYPLTGPIGSDTFIPMDMWSTIHQDILDQCDELDGSADGILESPDLCNYKPDGLLCGKNQTSRCLTTIQIETLRAGYSALLNADGDFVYPRLQPGAELTGAPQTLFTGEPFGAADWWRYAIFNDSDWDPLSLNPEDYDLSAHLNLFDIETWHGDLSTFESKGGKVLHYHGLADGVITSENSPRYYEHVMETMSKSPADLDSFYRFFRISGMAHCGGGPGAAFIGNTAQNSASLDPDENVLMGMVRWVEEGVAPDVVVGTGYVNGTESAETMFKRRHCRWPRRNKYTGDGDGTDVDGWACM